MPQVQAFTFTAMTSSTPPRGDLDKGDQHSGFRHASQPPSPSHQDRLREQLEDVHRQLSHTREIVDFYRAHGRVPPDQSQDDLENLQSKYAQLSLALEESLCRLFSSPWTFFSLLLP